MARAVEPTVAGEAPGSADVAAALSLAADLQREAHAREPRRVRRARARLGRLLADPAGRAAMLGLTDRVLRVPRPARAAALLAALPVEEARRFAGPVDALLLHAAVRSAPRLPWPTVPLVAERLRRETASVILPAEHRAYAAHAARRSAAGIRLNVNVLGEAVLGEEEAGRRRDALLERLSWPEVQQVSVKVSALCSQLDVLAFDAGVDMVAEQLRVVYAAAAAHEPQKRVDLDMEEYRDLHLTADAFMRVLSEEPFLGLDAGIVLQAYLPDSHDVLQRLGDWAARRHERGGGRIKVRLVKGANLAMEQVEAELHGWEQAPYATKAETDASYKRLLESALRPEWRSCLTVGLASHNAFDLAWGLTERAALPDPRRLGPEMLEGMAEGLARAVVDRTDDLLLYAPVAERRDFASSVAYLMRRLDENASEENFLRHQFNLQPGSAQWAVERDRFLQALADRLSVSTAPRRTQNRLTEQRTFPPDASFANEPDTDFSLSHNRGWLARSLAAFTAPTETVPAVVDGRDRRTAQAADGIDPSTGEVLYTYALADTPLVEEAVASALRAQHRWGTTTYAERRALLCRAAEQMARGRGEAVATMVRDGGKTVREADPEVSEAIDFARYYAECTRALAGLPDHGVGFAPLGVVVVASPWNFPWAIPAGGVLAALAAGNAVILKPAPETVLTAAVLARQLWAAGVPRDVLQLVPCPDDEVGRRLVTHPDVAGVVLTGSWDTAQRFLEWRPDLRLHAETSGKNALVITEAADLDAAVKDLVRSGFGHAGQKCSAASLAIVEAPVYDEEGFRRRLRDAVSSLVVGSSRELTTSIGPLIGPPMGPLEDALSVLQPGEEWLVAPRRVGGNPRLWSPGVKLGVAPGSSFHLTECFGPVLGLMRAADLEEAIALQNAPAYGLTGGIWSLDDAEVEHWLERVEVGNAYVNRHTTGAIVGRQPFGGWKRSAVGSVAKAGGPAYVRSIGRCYPLDDRADDDFEPTWRAMAAGEDPSGLRCETNVLRHRPLPRGVLLRIDSATPPAGLTLARAAAAVTGTPLEVSSPDDVPGAVREDDTVLAARLGGSAAYDVVRLLCPATDGLRRACHRAGVRVDDEPVTAYGVAELAHWSREQAVSRTRHRYGSVSSEPARVGAHPVRGRA